MISFAALSDAQLLSFRRTYVRDLAKPASGTSKAEYLSRYNNDTSSNFFSDDDLKDIDARNVQLYGVSLDRLWDDTKQRLIDVHVSDATAASTADVAVLDARFRLLRIEAYTRMMADPKYRATMMVGSDSGPAMAVFEQWNKQIAEDSGFRTWGESGGGVYSVRLVRR